MGYFAHPSSCIDENATVGDETKIWHFSHIMPFAVIGKKCTIGQNVLVANHVTIVNNVRIQNNVSLYEGVVCEDDVFIGPSVVFTNVINPRSFISRKNEYQKTLVKKGATIGANATILCGNEIGPCSFIGAGTVVTKSVPAYALVLGNPGKQVGWMSEYAHQLAFDKNHVAICPESNQQYQLENNQVVRIA
jgi:UDP-2-acetamido-3-amino-2,3-dideoxy-glucuronate N-acetyltransferase